MPSSDTSPGLPVVIVGGGPVGMAAATALAQAGISVVLVEATETVQTDWRASTFHPPTLELLGELGIVGDMLSAGLRVPRYQFRDRTDGLVAEFDFGLIADHTTYPFRLQLNQQHLVRMLADRLATNPLVTLRFGTRAITLREEADTVVVTVLTAGGTEELVASHVIGADGARSTVRRQLDIDFAGFTYPQRFLIASTSADFRELLPGIADVNYVADPEEWIFLLRTPESWRAVYPVPEGLSEQQATEPAEIQRHLQGIATLSGDYPIVDSQIYNVHQRVAATFRVGNVVLVGDAAHVNSPLGGVGLNSGIHDAIDVARRIARVRKAPEETDAELNLFGRLRRQVAIDHVQADTARNTERLAESDPARRAANYAELRAAAADPDRARAWCMRASLLESVQRFGIGLSPVELAERNTVGTAGA
jgi:2-polyprenyl-6-methoxyphenol hydroxylase-like FAD-dependent oxidoreductase